nr:hypothetical protein [uncultured Pedobacter sp.]
MATYNRFKFLFFAGLALALASCSTQKLATQNADDVYFKDVEAIPITYANAQDNSYKSGNYADGNGYNRNDDYYYDGYNNGSRFDVDTWRNNYNWRDYYYMGLGGYDPFFGPSSYLGFNNFYGNGWGFSLGYNTPYYGYNMPFYDNNYWNYYGSFYGNSPYWGIYSYYNPGYYGNYGGYYGSGYYGNPYYGGIGYYGTAKNLKARPRGTDDNVRGSDGSSRIPIPNNRATRPDLNGSNSPRTQSKNGNGSYNPYGRPSRSSDGNSSDRRTQGQQPISQPSNRPSRPTRDSGNTSEPVSQPTSRPARTETPTYTPSRSTESSGGSYGGGSSSGGRSSSGRPSR